MIRKEGYLYVDKTDFVWKLANEDAKYFYLSRPRRFGKTLLVEAMQCYFEGRKELFEGLKINGFEKDWIAYPVIHLDMSRAGETLSDLVSYLNRAFNVYETRYNVDVSVEDGFQTRFHDIISAASKASGLGVVVLIDEYDYPLQHSWGTPEHEKCAGLYRSVFTILKADSAYMRFVFLTGITKFMQISLFSALNNLVNISFEPEYESICGITEQEMLAYFTPEIEAMAKANSLSSEQTLANLKELYDGYHFSPEMTADIYNPFSLIYALNRKRLGNYWVASGASTLIMKFVKDAEIRLQEFDGCCVDANLLECSDITSNNAEVFLYQSGYLTIKGYRNGLYILKFPNSEIRRALYECVLPVLSMRSQDARLSTQGLLQMNLEDGKVPEAMDALKALISDVPYSNKKLASMNMEERYRLIISTILNAVGLNVEVEHMLSSGRIDLVASSRLYTYVIELKLQQNGGLDAAANQIVANHYLDPFQGASRKAIGLAIELDDLGKGMTGWRVVE